MNAKLPFDKLESTIASMDPGSGPLWTVPWAMVVDEEMNCWIRGAYATHDRPGGTVKMRVYRNPDGTYTVTVPRDTSYTPEEIKPEWIPLEVSGLNWFDMTEHQAWEASRDHRPIM